MWCDKCFCLVGVVLLPALPELGRARTVELGLRTRRKNGFRHIVVGLDITGPLRRFTEKAAKKIRAISAARKPKPWRRRS